MTEMRECSACGVLSYSVHPKIVEVTDEDVPGITVVRYVAELRCADSVSCNERTEAVGVTGPGERA